MAPILGYWNIRALGESIRLLLRYLDVEFKEKEYNCGNAPNYYHSDWAKEKFSLGLDFPNLPYYIDNDFKLTQSGAILEYIADQHGMVPKCKKEKAVLHMLFNGVTDIRHKLGFACYSPDFEKLKASMVADVHQMLKSYEDFLGDKIWLTGDKINYPDFNLCELLNQLVKFDPKFLEMFPKLQAYLNRFENLPQLRDYMNSEEFKTRPCFNLIAKWH